MPRSIPEGLVMWWVTIISLVLAYPAIEMAEEWRLRRAAEKELAEMRRHAASGRPMGCDKRTVGGIIL